MYVFLPVLNGLIVWYGPLKKKLLTAFIEYFQGLVNFSH